MRRQAERHRPSRGADACGEGGEATRRELIRIAGGGLAGVAFCAWGPTGIAAESVEEAVEALLVGREAAQAGHVRLELPHHFDYGNTVPLAVTVEGPMAETNHVRRVAVFAEGNPFPEVATFRFTPGSGRAGASTRIRLNEGEQEIVAVAEFSDDSVAIARRTIDVAISGCSVETGVVVGYPMPRPEPRLRAPSRARRGEIVQISTMISHWMETGLRIDIAGNPIPRRIINSMVCSRDGEPVFAAELSPAIAANAYLSFFVLASESAVLSFAWVEDGGAVYRAAHSLEVI